VLPFGEKAIAVTGWYLDKNCVNGVFHNGFNLRRSKAWIDEDFQGTFGPELTSRKPSGDKALYSIEQGYIGTVVLNQKNAG
jgi:hypothetical protein